MPCKADSVNTHAYFFSAQASKLEINTFNLIVQLVFYYFYTDIDSQM